MGCRLGWQRIFGFIPMILQRNQVIAGRPDTDIRKLLRKLRRLEFTRGFVAEILGCSLEEANQVVRALEKDGYLSRIGRNEGHEFFQTTLNGNQLAGANLRPITRVTAERILDGFMQRVEAVNSNPDYLARVTGVIVFGSFLSQNEELGDVDVGIQLEWKPSDDDTFRERAEARRKLAQAQGRQFRNVSDWATWPDTEVRLVLKSGARQLSIHDFSELPRLPAFRCRILLGNKRVLAKSLPNVDFIK